MDFAPHRLLRALLCALPIALTACGDSPDNTAPTEPTRYQLGGSVSGLSASGLVLGNGTDTVTVTSGSTSFAMPTAVPPGTAYAIGVQTQPSGQTCSVANGSGTMPAADMLNAVVTCAANAYSLGGGVSGLTTTGLVLANGADTIAVPANATSFTLPAAVASSSSWAVTVQTQPSGQSCSVTNGSGQMGAANVTNVSVSCTAQPFTLGGNISGLTTAGLVLANGSDTLTVAANASTFTLPTSVAYGSSFAVSVQTQPSGLTCSIASGSGTMGAANVSNVAVTCAVNSYTLGGNVSGLTTTGLVLANGSDTLAVAANASTFALPASVAFGGGYAVTVQTQPSGLTCSVASGSGTMGAGNVSNVAVTCAVNSYTLGGSVSGLTAAGLVLANGSDTLTVAANASSFTMLTSVAFNGGYAVAVQTQPSGLICSVADGSGTMGAGNVSNVAVTCAPAVYTVSTLAGSGSSGSTDDTGTAASFGSPFGTAVDASGNVYVADSNNHKIRKITAAGVVTTLAGSGSAGSADGTGAAASFDQPLGVAVDASGNVYVADQRNHKIRKVTAAGEVTTLAGSGSTGSTDGTGTAASFHYPAGVAVDAGGNVYVADTYSNKIRKVTPAGDVTTLAGSGSSGSTDDTGTAASFNAPLSVAVDASGNVYVADLYNQKIRKVTAAGVVTTLAGSGSVGSADGTGAAATFGYPYAVAVDAGGNVYVADTNNSKIRKVTAVGDVTTLAGTGNPGGVNGPAGSATFDTPTGVAVDGSGNVYVSEFSGHRVRKISAQ
jgi:NHL repeat